MKFVKESIFEDFYLIDLIGVFCVFAFIFSFYIVGPITSSIAIACCLVPYFLQEQNRKILFLSNYFLVIFLFLILALFLCVIYTNVIHYTNDLNYAKTLIGQLIQLISAFPLLCFLIRRKRVDKMERYIIIAYFIQSVIELCALFTPSLAIALLQFSRAEELYEGTGGVRGLALASGLGWNLALSFGVVYILIAKRILQSDTICVLDYIIYIFIAIGTFFAGRTGFVGMLYAGIFVIVYKHFDVFYILRVLSVFVLIIAIFYAVSLSVPLLYDVFNDKVFPFAFEWYYSMEETGEASTTSTDILMEMWKVPISYTTFLLGDGWFYDSGGEFYYKRTDIGVLRNILYWGILGYLVIIGYQVKQLSPLWKSKNIYGLMGLMILLYLFTMELKAMTIGFNKTVFSIVILVVYSYIYQYSDSKNYYK